MLVCLKNAKVLFSHVFACNTENQHHDPPALGRKATDKLTCSDQRLRIVLINFHFSFHFTGNKSLSWGHSHTIYRQHFLVSPEAKWLCGQILANKKYAKLIALRSHALKKELTFFFPSNVNICLGPSR